MSDEYLVMMSSSVFTTILYLVLCCYQGSVSLLLSQQLYYAMAFGVFTLYLIDYGTLHSYTMLMLWIVTWYVQTVDTLTATTIKFYTLICGVWMMVTYIILLIMLLTTNTVKLSELLVFLKLPNELRVDLNNMRVSLGRQPV